MNKLFMMNNPELFQGENKLKCNNYFEGWYFKNTIDNFGISFIPGIHIEDTNKKAFIQIITNEKSYYINYDFKDFSFSYSPFFIKIKDNFFSKEKLHLNICDKSQNICINGDLLYSNSQNINTTKLSPNIMGPFSFIPFMECNHAILAMKNNINGNIKVNDINYDFNSGTGYIEKDYGTSFPNSYIWCQGNNFKSNSVSFMLSIANIPFKLMSFTGIICIIIINKKEYKFTTYNFSKLVNYSYFDNSINLTIKKKNYILNIKCNNTNALQLKAPSNGKMNTSVLESISSTISVTLKENDNIIFCDTSLNCGLEFVK